MTTDIDVPTAESEEIYDTSSDPNALQRAADDLAAARAAAGVVVDDEPEAPEVDVKENTTSAEAAEALSDYRARRAAEVEAFNKAMGLDPQQLEALSAEQPAAEAQEQPPQEQLQQQQQAERDYAAEATRQQLAASDQQVSQAVRQLQAAEILVTANFQAAFPDVRTDADLIALASRDPARYQQAVEHVQYAQQVTAAQQQIAQAVAQENAAIFQNWADSEDRAFDEAHPELADPVVKNRLGNAAAKMLQDVGLSENEIRALYHGHASINLRDKRTQEVLLDAIRYREAQRAVKQMRPDATVTSRRVTRSVQGPGTPMDEAAVGRATVREATARLKGLSGARAMDAAVELLNAQRRARG